MAHRDYAIARHTASAATFKRWPKRPKWEKKEIDQLKAEFIAKYGYGVLIPDFDDIMHYKTDSQLTKTDRQNRKAKNLYRLLASPTPGWARSYASAMCWLDNIQDAMTTGLVLSMVLKKWAPKIFARAVPVLGWFLLGHDLLSFLVQMGRVPFTPMKSKRALCQIRRSNPFTKKAKRIRHRRLWALKPSWAAACEVAQTTDWLFGVGLSLGAIFGTITDTLFAGYKYITGDPVKFHMTPPVKEMYDITGFHSMKSAAMISAAGQVFDDELHFWTYMTYTGGVVLTAPIIEYDPPDDYPIDPMTVLIPADRPTNPETIQVIQDAGLSVEDGVRWPANQQKEISLDDLSDWQAENCYNSVSDYLIRHDKDWYGFLAASFMHEAHNHLLEALDPEAEVEQEYTPITHVVLQMLKYGITPTDETQKQEWSKFEQWCDDYRKTHTSMPGMSEITQHLDMFNLSWQDQFPEEQDDRSLEVFPEGAANFRLWEQDIDKLIW